MRTALISFLIVIGLAGIGLAMEAGPEPSSKAAFQSWLREDASRRAAFDAFSAYLDKQGVGEVVPIWQLARVDGQYAARCRLGYFALPPRAQWSQIVPALKLVREQVIPVTGPVEVVSSWRSPEINACVGGASRSAHLDFKALDLVAVKRNDRRQLFADLCAMQRAAGRASRMGLGAYYNPGNPVTNWEGRFHIDAHGYRTWGFDYTAKSNPCPKLR